MRTHSNEGETARGILDDDLARCFSSSTLGSPGFDPIGVGMPLGSRLSMNELIDILLHLGHAALATEEAACDALAAARWPRSITCPACGSPCTRDVARVECSGKRHHRFTLFTGTPLGSKLRPSVRAVLLAVRAMTSHRSISAAELATVVGMNRVTLWRHLHSVRAALPAPAASALPGVRTRVTGRGRQSAAPPSFIHTPARICGENVRAWLVGTFHGVTAHWLRRYLQEHALRTRLGAGVDVARTALLPFVNGAHAITFARARNGP